MISVRPEPSADDRRGPATDVEGDIRQLVRGQVASDRRSDLEPSGKDTATETNAFIDRVSVTSAKEIAKLIADLQNLRDFLHSEGQRVQREISGYVHLNEAAAKATKLIVEAIPQWKKRVKAAPLGDNLSADRPF